MQQTCRKCGAQFAAEDVHADLGIAKCRACRTIVDLATSEAVAATGSRTSSAVQRNVRRDPVLLPSAFQFDQTPSSLAVWWRWFGPKYVFLGAFCAFWDAFLFMFIREAIQSSRPALAQVPWPHLVIGMVMTWWCLAGLLNRTRVEVRGGTLRIRHFPIPWVGNRVLHGRDLDQLYAVEHETRTKNGGVILSYRVCALLKSGGGEQVLVSGLQRPHQALFLEQQIEEKLGIEDRKVFGELPRD